MCTSVLHKRSFFVCVERTAGVDTCEFVWTVSYHNGQCVLLLQVHLKLQTQRCLKCTSLSWRTQPWQLIISLLNSDSISITLQQCMALSRSHAPSPAHPQSIPPTNNRHCSSISPITGTSLDSLSREDLSCQPIRGVCQRGPHDRRLIWRLVAPTRQLY